MAQACGLSVDRAVDAWTVASHDAIWNTCSGNDPGHALFLVLIVLLRSMKPLF